MRMINKVNGLIDRALHRRGLARWRKVVRASSSADFSVLREQRQQARQLRLQLEELTYIADNRLALPRIGSTTFVRPPGTVWSWRPQAWRGTVFAKGIAAAADKSKLGDEVTVFHDCKVGEVTLRQIRNTQPGDLAPFGLRAEVFHFDGSFLSLVVDLPAAACLDLKRSHLIRLGLSLDLESPVAVSARLNIKHGPNTAQILLALPPGQGDVSVEFDLAYAEMNEKRVERMWLDLIFEKPQMNQITIRDLTMSRYPRAAL